MAVGAWAGGGGEGGTRHSVNNKWGNALGRRSCDCWDSTTDFPLGDLPCCSQTLPGQT